MLKFGNKEFRNLQEQVEENMRDIANLKSGQAVLDEFGIKVVGEVESVEDMPTVSEYKEATPDWEYGDAYAVGSTSPYTLYILTRANGTHEEDYWFDIGVFPMPGPQGEQGPQGPEGQQGQTGDTGPAGADAGFGTPTATATMTTRGSTPTVNVTASGPNTEKVFNFDFYLPVATPKVTITSASGSLTLAEYNILFNFEDSVVVFKPSSSLANTAYTLQRWYANDDYIVFICLYNYTPYKTGVYRCRVDRSNRNYLIYADEPIKINKYNISTAIDSSTNETAGKVLTADGNGGASWEDAGSIGSSTVTITVTSGTFSDSDYTKVASDGCTVIYDDNTTKVSFRKYTEDSTTITYAGPFTESNITYWYGLTVNKAGKTWVMSSAAMPISASNIKSGSYVSGLVLTTNGSGGSSWESLPAQTQADWNESSVSSPAYIKNKPTIPTVPVTDVTVNGTSVMDGTTAKVLVDTVDGATDGTNWTSLTINGTTAAIPQGSSGTVTSVGLSAASGSNLSVSGSPITSSGSMTVGVASGYSIPSTTDQNMWNGDMKYKGQVGSTVFGADINWNDLLSSGTTVKKGDTYYVRFARTSTPVCSLGNLIVAESDGTGASTTWKVVPTGSISGISLGGTSLTSIGSLSISTGTAYNQSTNPLATMADVTGGSSTDVQINGISIVSSGVANIITEGTYDATTNKIATMSDLPSVPVTDVKINNQSIVINNEVNLGSASVCDVTNSITSGSSDVVTGGSIYTALSGKLDSTACTYQTTAPTAAISDGGVHIVYLSAEPATKYSGYIYLIAEA